MSARPFLINDEGVRLFIRLTPNAKKNAVGDVMSEGLEQAMLKVSVTAIPEKGKANTALVKLLSKEWKFAKSDFEIVSGLTDRRKVLQIYGKSADIEQRLTSWMKVNHV